MDASVNKMSDFLSLANTEFIIPVYQRNYDWTLIQCQQLLNDIQEAGKNDKIHAHFIGSITYAHNKVYSSNKIKDFNIIDGQQRLTTATLIYIVLYWLYKDKGYDDDAEEIEHLYLKNKFVKNKEKLKLRPTENNSGALQYLLRDNRGEDFSEYSRIIQNFEFFKQSINLSNAKIIQDGLAKLMFVEISVDRTVDDPQKIYESMNSTGLALSESDKIRNSILMGFNSDDQEVLYKDYWYHVEHYTIDEVSNDSKTSDFIRDYLTIENRDIPPKRSVYEIFKKTFLKQGEVDINEAKEILVKIKKFASHYNKLINPVREKDEDIRTNLESINKLQINASYPFLMELYEDYCNKVIPKEVLIRILELVQSFIVRRFIVGLPYGALNNLFKVLHRDVIDKKDYFNQIAKSLAKRRGSSIYPKDAEVIEALRKKDFYGIEVRKRNYILSKIEHFHNRERVNIEDNSSITVEHIFPKKPHANWRKMLSNDEFDLFEEKYLHTIANLTLSGNNGALGNKVFVEKRDMNKVSKTNPEGRQGYKYSNFWLNEYLKSIDKWGKEELENRFNIISERFIKIWYYPEVKLDEISDDQELNIFDVDAATNMKLDYVIFQEQKLEIKQFSDLYLYILNYYLDNFPEFFFNASKLNKIVITNSSDSFRKPALLNNNLFTEASYSNQDRLKLIKDLLRLHNNEDDLLVKISKKAENKTTKAARTTNKLKDSEKQLSIF